MWRDQHLLLDMLIYARRAVKFNSTATWERFQSDEMLQAATQYALQIIGEAASKISRNYRAEHPEISWDKIIAFRHRMVHDYPRIELPKVWGGGPKSLASADHLP
ncbi:MAG TPA: HepT-like ribonuclease domain-containing protein [Tepidisphaeraceae bacterium]|nr:HepT-like ribonuclease domain-containing protein [Tepidisphaeraceae bacterium]